MCSERQGRLCPFGAVYVAEAPVGGRGAGRRSVTTLGSARFTRSKGCRCRRGPRVGSAAAGRGWGGEGVARPVRRLDEQGTGGSDPGGGTRANLWAGALALFSGR